MLTGFQLRGPVRLLGLCLAAIPFCLAGTAGAQEIPKDEAPSEGDSQSLGKHQDHTQVSLGVRTSLVRDAGYDPYAEDDVFTQGSIGASHALFVDGAWSVAGAFGFDFGGVNSNVRGEHSELDAYRFTLAPELRFHLLPRLYFLGRLGPSLTYDRVKISDEVAATDLSSAGLSFGFDAALGAAYEVLGRTSGAHKGPRGWIQLELGYGWSSSRDITLEARGSDADSAPERLNGVAMPALSLSGPAVKVAVAASF
ncbi:MAG: hypothetical protein H6718_06810 [Polyangiaceae bacterium]|nr:hypothetical protein [Myxococcales bacterium]MCB9585089.1 hypothetical protein [Polyangiaceae bacterium]